VLIPALLLLLYDSWAMTRRIVRLPAVGALHPSVIALLVASVSAFGCARPPDPARLFADGDRRGAIAAYRALVAKGDTTAMTKYNLGTALLGSDSLAEAVELLEAVRRSTDGELRMRARYNAGLAQLLLGRMSDNPDANQALAAARAAYRALLQDRSADDDAKWNYELALRHPPPNSGGGGGGGGDTGDSPENPSPPQGSLDQRQAEALLNSAAREERDVQGRKQQKGRIAPVGKDW
jgi:Ca-activated chloride channel family protein